MVPKLRAQEAPKLIVAALETLKPEVVVLDDMQVLFAPVLQVDPLHLLRQLSRKFSVVAAWPGEFDGNWLKVSASGQAEPKNYDAKGLTIIQIE